MEQGFRLLTREGWHGHRTRRLAPRRVARHWLVMAIATLLTRAHGTRVEDAHLLGRHPWHLTQAPLQLPVPTAARVVSVFRLGLTPLRRLCAPDLRAASATLPGAPPQSHQLRLLCHFISPYERMLAPRKPTAGFRHQYPCQAPGSGSVSLMRTKGPPRSVTPITAVPGWRGASSPPARDCCLLLPYKGPRKPDDLVALAISVVYRQHAHPRGPRVAWHIVGAQAEGSWIDHFCRLLRLLAPAVPATVPVHVLCDQGLGSRDLWAQMVAFGHPLGGHPCLRYQPHVTFQPAGQTRRLPVRSLITGPGDLWVGAGRAFRDEPVAGTLIVLHAYGEAQPWVLLTNTPVAQTEPTLYACRNWIEQGFRGLKTVGWKWHKTRRLDPGALGARVGRHWLVLAIATLLAVAYGTRREEAEVRHREPGAFGARLRRRHPGGT